MMNKTSEQAFFETLDEKQKRLYAGMLANSLGYFGVRQAAERLGINRHTVRAGQKDLAARAAGAETSTRIRREGGGRKKKLKPNLASARSSIK